MTSLGKGRRGVPQISDKKWQWGKRMFAKKHVKFLRYSSRHGAKKNYDYQNGPLNF